MMVSDAVGIPFYVLRAVEGDLKVTKQIPKRSNDTGLIELVKTEVIMEEPVIVFMPNATCQVMTLQQATQKGFTRQPQIMGFKDVEEGQNTPASRYKSALDMEDRQQAWVDMENIVINATLATCGMPVPQECSYSEKSFYIKTPTIETKVADPFSKTA